MRPRYKDLFQALRDPDPARADAAFDAILFDRASAIPELAEAYRLFPKESTLRFCIVQLLGFTEDARAVPHVMEALRDPDPLVRAEACRALEDLRARDATQALLERSQDLDPVVREAAKEALGAMNTPFDPPPDEPEAGAESAEAAPSPDAPTVAAPGEATPVEDVVEET